METLSGKWTSPTPYLFPLIGKFRRVGQQRRKKKKRKRRTSRLKFLPIIGAHNLSQRVCSKDELEVLNLGLKFTPTPLHSHPTNIEKGLSKLIRSIRLAHQFGNGIDKRSVNSSFRLPNPSYTAKKADTHVESFISELKTRITDAFTRTYAHPTALHYKPDNMSKEARRAILSLKQDSSIIIGPADKNLGLTIMDKSWYHNEMCSQLHDTSVYEQVDDTSLHTAMKNIATKIKIECQSWLNDIPMEVAKYIKAFPNPCAPCPAYILPKIHKEEVKGRLISPNNKWATLNLSKWLAHKLNEVAVTIPTILKDSRELIRELEPMWVPKTTHILTFDVISLYPNIVHSEARKNIETFFQGSLQPCILNLLDIVMENNYLTYDNCLYKQIRGTAMGTPVAPPYANLFLAKLERDLISQMPIPPLYYKRFIDDGIILWDGPTPILEDFLSKWNSSYDTIKITCSPLSKSVDFLDLSISIDEDRVNIDGFCTIKFTSYEKPLNKFLYIPFHSYCPRHIFKGFIKGRIISLIVNNSKEEDFNTFSKLLRDRLKRRGYPSKFLNLMFASVSYSNRAHFISDKHHERDSQRKFALFLNYTPISSEAVNLKHIVKNVYDSHFENIKGTIPNCPIVGYYKGKSIGSLIINNK
jgi:hypothetical protein